MGCLVLVEAWSSQLYVICAGVQSYTVDYKQQKATVIGTADPEEIMSRIRRSGKTVTLISKSPAPAEAPKEEAKPEEKKEPGKAKEVKPLFSFRPKMPNLRPKMSGLKMSDLQKRMSTLKMQDLQKKMPNLCDSMPKNFVTNACREFMSKGVFYAASHDISDSELESLKRETS